MQRILAAGRNAVLDLFGSGKHGFGAGNANTGTPASTPGPEWFNAIQETVARAIESDGIVLDGSKYDQLATVIAERIRRFAAGATLPVQNIGPIWHDDYNSMMTWQSFTNNGANYVGYASVLVGGLLIDTQPTARVGYIKSGTMNLSRTAYAALRNWAIHNGIAVAVGVWAAGTIAIADNADGTTFRVFDVRGEFPRFLDDGRGVDTGRVFGSWQNSQISAHDHDMWSTAKYVGVTLSGGAVAPYASGTSMGLKTGISGGGEDRPRNVAMLSCIKF